MCVCVYIYMYILQSILSINAYIVLLGSLIKEVPVLVRMGNSKLFDSVSILFNITKDIYTLMQNYMEISTIVKRITSLKQELLYELVPPRFAYLYFSRFFLLASELALYSGV